MASNVWIRHNVLASAIQGNVAAKRSTSRGGSRTASPSRGKISADRDDDSTALATAISRTTSSVSCVSSASAEWGWIKACMVAGGAAVETLSADGSSIGGSVNSRRVPPLHRNSSGDMEDLSISVTVTDPESEFDGRTVKLPRHTMGEGVLMANAWANFSAAPTQVEFDSANPSADTIAGGPMDVPPEDLIHLTHLHEPAVVYCLRYRYFLDEIYTATGPILLALNPFKDCRKSLYSPELMQKYWQRGEGVAAASVATSGKKDGSSSESFVHDNSLPPHVYAVADNAYRAMMRALDDQRGRATPLQESANQAVLVSGESGAGKTVTAKFLMQYLAALSQRSVAKILKAEEANRPVFAKQEYVPASSRQSGITPARMSHFGTAVDSKDAPPRDTFGSPASPTSPRGGRPSNIEQQVLQSNPILESFGNARTVRNDNSSRFGKFIEINFSETGTLVGASIETYLLEKVRLISHMDGERNYHIFHELLAGASTIDKKQLMIDNTSPEDYAMTRSSSGTYFRRDGVSDESTYAELKGALNTMGIDEEEQLDIFEIIAALLHLSNLGFVEQGVDECILNEDNNSLGAALELMGVTFESLEASLCSVVLEAAGERVTKLLGTAQSTKALEALIKATYGALFEYLVKKVNDCITNVVEIENTTSPETTQNERAAFIGVLDIFGFESFAVNSFEQLCINYCNESLQQQFNRFIFKLEQSEYEREGISWKFIDFPDNQNILDIIDKRHTGVLSILDEQCMQAFNTDQTFANSMYDHHGKQADASNPFQAGNTQKVRGLFSIHHYAGAVEYNTSHFLEKNKDETPKEINELLAGSENHFLQHLGEIIMLRPVVSKNRTTSKGFGSPVQPQKQSSLRRVSVGAEFSSQLKQLRSRIDATAPHYIRCLKPNDELRADHFDRAIIADQLRYAGILEAIRVSRVGYPQRYLHDRFLSRYRILAAKEMRSRKPGNALEDCKFLVDVIAKKLWARKHSVILVEENPFSLPHTRGKKKKRASDGKPAIRASPMKTPSKRIAPRTPITRIPPVDKYRANSTPPAWAQQKLRPATPTQIVQKPMVPVEPPSPSPERKGPAKPQASTHMPTPKQTTSSLMAEKPPPTEIPAKIDLIDVGVQHGKTKVFLRQHAFDAMENMRNRLKTTAATMINSVAKMYLCRMAYLPVRDAFREEMEDPDAFWKASGNHYDGIGEGTGDQHSSLVLIDKFEEFRVKPEKKKARVFKWLLVDGRWTLNVSFEDQRRALMPTSSAE